MQRHFRTRKIRAIILIITTIAIATITCAADSNVVSVTATVLSRGNCTFRSKTAALNFGSLDPANPIDKSVETTIIYRCQAQGNKPITFAINDDSGLYETGPNAPRMRHTTELTEYLPYSLALTPTSGTVSKTIDFPLRVTGTLRGVDYQSAAMGSYSDTVVVSIEP
jgi:spore coat protein U-like protein